MGDQSFLLLMGLKFLLTITRLQKLLLPANSLKWVIGNNSVLHHYHHYQKFNSTNSRSPFLISHLFSMVLFRFLDTTFIPQGMFRLRLKMHTYVHMLCIICSMHKYIIYVVQYTWHKLLRIIYTCIPLYSHTTYLWIVLTMTKHVLQNVQW